MLSPWIHHPKPYITGSITLNPTSSYAGESRDASGESSGYEWLHGGLRNAVKIQDKNSLQDENSRCESEIITLTQTPLSLRISILNVQSSSFNLHPEVQPLTLKPQPSTLNPQL